VKSDAPLSEELAPSEKDPNIAQRKALLMDFALV
jgi:hypothetical protein